MTVWLRARRAGWCAVVAVAMALLAGLAAGRLPSLNLLYRSSEGAPLRLVVPAVVATAVLSALVTPVPRAELVATRTPGRDLALCAVMATASIAVAGVLPAVMGDVDAGGVFARNLVGFLGLGLLGRAVLPRSLAPLLPLVWMIPTLTLGRPEGDLLSWPLLPDAGDPRGLLVAAALLAAGITADRASVRRPVTTG